MGKTKKITSFLRLFRWNELATLASEQEKVHKTFARWWLVEVGLFLTVGMIAFVPRVLDLDVFVTFDEEQIWAWSNQFTQAVRAGVWQHTANNAYPAVTLMWLNVVRIFIKSAISSWFTGQGINSASLPETVLSIELLAEWRLMLALVNAVLILLIYLLLRKGFSQAVAVGSIILIALDPFFLTQSRVARVEALVTGLMLMSVLALVVYLNNSCSKKRYLVISGVSAGLAIITKISALFLIPFTLLVLLLWSLFECRRSKSSFLNKQLLQTVTDLLWWVGSATLIILAAWPALWVDPLGVYRLLYEYVGSLSTGLNLIWGGREVFFLGEVIYGDPGLLFYLVALAFRTTPVVWLGLVMLIAWSLVRMVGLSLAGSLLNQDMLGVTVSGFYALFYLILMATSLAKVDRYLIPIFPSLDIVAAVGLTLLGQLLWKMLAKLPDRLAPLFKVTGPVRIGWKGVALGGLLAIQIATVMPVHPYYFTYWNPILGGGQRAVKVLPLGSGEGIDLAMSYLNEQPQATQLTLICDGVEGLFCPFFFKGNREPLRDFNWITADYILLYIFSLQRGSYPAYLLNYLHHSLAEYKVSLNGVDYAYLFPLPAVKCYSNDKLEGKARLLGYTEPAPAVMAGDSLKFKSYWQNLGLAQEEELYIRLVDANNYEVAWSASQVLPGFKTAALSAGEIVESEVVLTVPVGTPPGVYFLRSGVYSQAKQEVIGEFELQADCATLLVMRPSTPPQKDALLIEHLLDNPLTLEISLLGFDLADDTLYLNEENQLALWWQAQREVKHDHVVSLQLLDSMGEERAYWLGRPVLGGYSTNQWQAGEVVRDPWQLKLPAEILPGDYTLQLTLYDTDTETQVSRVKLDQVSVVTRRRQFVPPNMDHPVNVSLDGWITLLGYDLVAEPIARGGRLRVTLYWKAQEVMKDSYIVFVQLLKPDGTLAAQHDGPPASGAILTNDWAVGEVVTDRHQVEFANLPPGDYTLVTGMYLPTTGERLPTSSGDTAIRLQALPISQ